MVANIKEMLPVSKQAKKKFDMKRFNLRKLNKRDVRNQYRIKNSNRFAAFENLHDSDDINRAWEKTEEDIKTSAKESQDLCELKLHKPRFDEEGSQFLDQRKQAKMQWFRIQTTAMQII